MLRSPVLRVGFTGALHSTRTLLRVEFVRRQDMASVWSSVVYTPRLQMNTSFAGFQVSQLPSLRAFRCAGSSNSPAKLRKSLIRCSASEVSGVSSSSGDLPLAHIAALDNRASGEDLLELLRLKHAGTVFRCCNQLCTC